MTDKASTESQLIFGENSPSLVDEVAQPHPFSTNLTAWTALVILVAYLFGQVAGVAFTNFFAGIVAGIQGFNLNDPSIRSQFNQAITGPAALMGMFIGALVVINLARYFSGGSAHFHRALGWSRCTWSDLGLGFAAGLLIGFTYMAIAVFIVQPELETPTGPVTKMAYSPGITRVYWVLLVLAIAPPLEEFLFRGVLFTGLSKSWGVPAASVGVTALFVLMHVTEFRHYWPAGVAIALAGTLALFLRIRTGSLGPAVALHVAYNLTIAVGVFASMAS